MFFNSIEFVIFFVAVVLCYYRLDCGKQNIWLLVASYIFYGWWDWRFLLLIFFSTCADYFLSNRLESTRDTVRKKLVWCSVFVNLGLLCTFKYFNFFVDSFVELGLIIGVNFDTPTMRLLPPVGISFYTFQTMSYTIDVYKRRISAEKNFLIFALFVSYFPQLVAGPIERAKRLLPQFQSKRLVYVDDVKSGLVLILIGLFKKIVIADSAGIRVDSIYNNPVEQSSLVLFVAAALFMLQIYGDFSGYSNIARGISRLLGIRLVENFKTPYFSSNISEFWKRWHISLSEWLRDYLYIPLGGSRGTNVATGRNLMITMILGGLWHGAAWTYVAWGFINGIYLIVHRYWLMWLQGQNKAIQVEKSAGFNINQILKKLLSIALTLIAVMVAFIFFRAESIAHAVQILGGILELRGPLHIGDIILPGFLVCCLAPIEFLQYRGNDRLLAVREVPVYFRILIYLGICLCLILASQHERPFIYFQF